ncbi:PhzF family phenazine biosynthesis protein [Desulfotignum balticum]|uniref:PhzF family phenazine biosynthesis protein n=1 Tax=Desulfotignum balticum TaxID=115781 RepID=UPI0003FDC26B|nr:PhzF family phenazine biosynthesis protein [Desulfotignum balticum]
MNIPMYQVDAFTSTVFSGNPAAVCLLDTWLDDAVLQAVAAENNLSETAFLVQNTTGFDLRWFTPVTEVALCGHATLASAFVQFFCQHWNKDTIVFDTRHSGPLTVARKGDLLEMDFPSRPPAACELSENLSRALGEAPQQVYKSAEDLMAVFDSETTVAGMQPDIALLAQLDWRGIIITAPGDHCDFVSRFFGPKVGVPEDPVTGSAHCVLIPYWASVLDKNDLHARQVSQRGGELFCQLAHDRVRIAGRAALYLEGMIKI